MAGGEIVRDYDRLFDPEWYLKTYYGGMPPEEDPYCFLFKGIHSAFVKGDIQGSRLLDIGTGPSICSVISAVPHFKHIYLSDYLDLNRTTLQKWLNGSAGHSFQEFFQHFLKLEGKEEQDWADREEELRRKVKAILKCDLLQSHILEDENLGQVDAITSSLCLEVAARDLPCYGEICKKIACLLVDGGYVVLSGVLEETFYMVNGHRFYSLFISKEDLIKAWENAGFSIVNFAEAKAPPAGEDAFADPGGVFVLVARKNQ